MSMLRLKRIAHNDLIDTPHVIVKSANGEGLSYPCKLQLCVCIDTDNTHTFWEWQDVEVVEGDALDYEEEYR